MDPLTLARRLVTSVTAQESAYRAFARVVDRTRRAVPARSPVADAPPGGQVRWHDLWLRMQLRVAAVRGLLAVWRARARLGLGHSLGWLQAQARRMLGASGAAFNARGLTAEPLGGGARRTWSRVEGVLGGWRARASVGLGRGGAWLVLRARRVVGEEAAQRLRGRLDAARAWLALRGGATAVRLATFGRETRLWLAKQRRETAVRLATLGRETALRLATFGRQTRLWLSSVNRETPKELLTRSRAAFVERGLTPDPLIRRARGVWEQHAIWIEEHVQLGAALLALSALGVILYLAYQADHPRAVPAASAERAPVLPTLPAPTLVPTRVVVIAPPSTATPRPTSTPVPATATPVPAPAIAVPRPAADLPTVPVRLRLVDQGGMPIIFDPALGAFRQDLSADGTNVYAIGDVFVDPRDEREWTWVGGVTFVSPVGVLTLDAFR